MSIDKAPIPGDEADKPNSAPEPKLNADDPFAAMRSLVERTQTGRADLMQGIQTDLRDLPQDDQEFMQAMYEYSGIIENTSARGAVEVDMAARQILASSLAQFRQQKGREPTAVERNLLYNQAERQATRMARQTADVRYGAEAGRFREAMQDRDNYFRTMEMFNAGLSENATPEERQRFLVIREHTLSALNEIKAKEAETGVPLSGAEKMRIMTEHQNEALKKVGALQTKSLLLPEDPDADPAEQAKVRKFNAATEKIFDIETEEGGQMQRKILKLSNDLSLERNPQERKRMRRELEDLLKEQYAAEGVDLSQEDLDRLIKQNTDLDLEKYINRVDSMNVIAEKGSEDEQNRFFEALQNGDEEALSSITQEVADRTGDKKLSELAARGKELTEAVNERNRERALRSLSALPSENSYRNLPYRQQLAVGKSLQMGSDPEFITLMLQSARPNGDGLTSNIEGMSLTMNSDGQSYMENTEAMNEASAATFEQAMVRMLATRVGAREAFGTQRDYTDDLIKAFTRINIKDGKVDGSAKYAKLEQKMKELFASAGGDAFAVLEDMNVIQGGEFNATYAKAWGIQLRALGSSRALPQETYRKITEQWQQNGEPFELFTPVSISLLKKSDSDNADQKPAA